MIEEVYICPLCGSKEIEGKAWVNMNKSNLKQEDVTYPETMEEKQDYWCTECQNHIIPEKKEI